MPRNEHQAHAQLQQRHNAEQETRAQWQALAKPRLSIEEQARRAKVARKGRSMLQRLMQLIAR